MRGTIAAILAALLSGGLARASDGVVILAAGADAPEGIVSRPAADVLRALGLEPASPPGSTDASAALEAYSRSERFYLQRAQLAAAVDAMREARALLPSEVASEQRPAVVRALWFNGQLLSQVKRTDEARDVVDLALRIDPAATPPAEDFPQQLRALVEGRRAHFLATARQVTVRAAGDLAKCAVTVDGVERGRVGEALGPFQAGERRVGLACGARPRWERRVTIGATDVLVEAAPFERTLTVGGAHLVSEDPSALAAAVLARSDAPWVLVLAPSDGMPLRATLHRRGQAPAELGGARTGSDVRLWLAGVLNPPAIPGPRTASSPWWQWTLFGTGLAAAATGGVFYGVAVHDIDVTNEGDEDRRDEAQRYGKTGAGLLAAGGSVAVAGLILALFGSSDGEGTVILPAADGVSIVGRF